MANSLTDRYTGYEAKILRAVIENWLYHPDPQERILAGVEVRKRMQQRFPRPTWLPEKEEQK